MPTRSDYKNLKEGYLDNTKSHIVIENYIPVNCRTNTPTGLFNTRTENPNTKREKTYITGINTNSYYIDPDTKQVCHNDDTYTYWGTKYCRINTRAWGSVPQDKHACTEPIFLANARMKGGYDVENDSNLIGSDVANPLACYKMRPDTEQATFYNGNTKKCYKIYRMGTRSGEGVYTFVEKNSPNTYITVNNTVSW